MAVAKQAKVVDVLVLTPDTRLITLELEPLGFVGGQYLIFDSGVVLDGGKLAKRAYSISCSMLEEGGVIRRASGFPYLEFYVSLVRHGRKRPPSLTPRLFVMHAGDRLFVERHAFRLLALEHFHLILVVG